MSQRSVGGGDVVETPAIVPLVSHYPGHTQMHVQIYQITQDSYIHLSKSNCHSQDTMKLAQSYK